MKPLPAIRDDAQDAVLARQLTDQYKKAVGGILNILIFGAMMLKLRDLLSARGQGNINNLQKAGEGLKGWLVKNCPEINRATAYRFMFLADNLRMEFQIGDRTDLELLLSAPVKELKPSWQKQQAKIFEFIEGKSQRQLMLAFARDRGDIGGNPALYKWLKEFHSELVGEYTRPKDLPSELRAEFDEWFAAQAVPDRVRYKMSATDTWRRLMRELTEEGSFKKTWGHLDRAEMERLYNLLNDIRKEIAEALKK